MTGNNFAAKSYTFGWGNHDFLCDFFILSTSFPELPLAVPGFFIRESKVINNLQNCPGCFGIVFFRDNLDIFVFTFFYGDLQKKNIAYKMKNIDSRKIIYNTSFMRNKSWYLRKFFGSFFLVQSNALLLIE